MADQGINSTIHEVLAYCYVKYGTYIEEGMITGNSSDYVFKYKCTDILSKRHFSIEIKDRRWGIYSEEDELIESGVDAERRLSSSIIKLARSIHSDPETRHIEATSNTVKKVLGWGTLSLVLLLARVYVILNNGDVNDTLYRVRIFVSSSGISDIGGIAAGSMLNLPTVSLCIIAIILWILAQAYLPRVQFKDDTLSPAGATLMIAPLMLATIALIITDNMSRIIILMAIAVIIWCEVPLRLMNYRLSKWQKYARKGGADIAEILKNVRESETKGDADHKPSNDSDTKVTLASQALRLQQQLWQERDKALSDDNFRDLYSRAHVLWFKERSGNRKWGHDEDKVARRLRFSSGIFGMRNFLSRSLPIIILLPLSLMLILDPTPWTTPSCLESDDSDPNMVFQVPGNGNLVILDSDRDIKHIPQSESDYLSYGRCSSEIKGIVDYSIIPYSTLEAFKN